MDKMNLQLFGQPSNQQIIQKGRTMAAGQVHGMLNPEQSDEFMKMVFDDSSFLGQLRHEMRGSTKGSIEKLGIGRRLLKPKIEGIPIKDEDLVEPVLSSVKYSTEDMVLGAEVTEKFYRENIEKANFEDVFMGMIASQVKIDMLDLAFNGDESYTGADQEFITMNDGILKLLTDSTSTNKLDAATLAGGNFIDDIFTKAIKLLPSKYFDINKFKWIASHKTYITWLEYLKQKDTTAGDMAILNGTNMNPLAIGWEIVPNFPDDVIILGDPKNFTIVTTYDMKLRKTVEGKAAVMNDMRFYALHMDMDTIIMEDESVVLIQNVPDSV